MYYRGLNDKNRVSGPLYYNCNKEPPFRPLYDLDDREGRTAAAPSRITETPQSKAEPTLTRPLNLSTLDEAFFSKLYPLQLQSCARTP